MGMDYYLVDMGSKTFYELGRGDWFALNDNTDALADEEYLVMILLEECCRAKKETHPEEWGDWKKSIEERIAPDLHKAFGNSLPEELFIINDSTDDLYLIRCRGYKCIGSRFDQPDSKEYIENIAYKNRHLDIKNQRNYMDFEGNPW